MQHRKYSVADIALIVAVAAAIAGFAILIAMPARSQTCPNPYCPGGTAVRVYDGGTGAHDAFNARRNLGITAGALTGLRDSLSSIYYSAIQDPLLRVKDSQFFVKNATDTTKKFQFDASPIATGTTRLFSMPNKSGTIALLGDLSGGGLVVYDPLLRVKDADFFIKDDGDTTKKLQVNLANLTTATTRTDSVPDISSLLAAARHTNTFSRLQTFTSNTDEGMININSNSAYSTPPFQVFDESGNWLSYVDNSGLVAGASGFGVLAPLSGNFIQVTNKNAIAVSRTYKIDNAITGTPDFVMTSGTQTISGTKTYNGTSLIGAGQTAARFKLWCDGTTARTHFGDQADTSKTWAFDISGFTTATTRKLTPPNYTGGLPLLGLNTGAAAAGQIGKRDLTAQTAAIGSTNLTSSALAGVYEIQYYLEDTTADATAGTIQFQINYTDDVGATNQTSAALALTATGRTFGTLVAYLNSGELSYQTNLVGIIGTSQYALRFRVTYKG